MSLFFSLNTLIISENARHDDSNKIEKRAILTADEFYKTASDSDLFKKVTLEIIEEEKKNLLMRLRYVMRVIGVSSRIK